MLKELNNNTFIPVLLLLGGLTGPKGRPSAQSEYMTNCPGSAPVLPSVPDLPLNVSRHVGGLHGQGVMLCGGYSYSGGGVMSTCYLWTPGEDLWTPGQQMKSKRYLAASRNICKVSVI